MNREIPPLESKRLELERRVSRDEAVLRRKQELLSRSSALLAECNAMLARARAGDEVAMANNRGIKQQKATIKPRWWKWQRADWSE